MTDKPALANAQLAAAGLTSEQQRAIILLRLAHGHNEEILSSDAAMYTAIPDIEILTWLAETDVSTFRLITHGRGRIILSSDDFNRCRAHQIDPLGATRLIARAPLPQTDDPLGTLIEAVTAIPGTDSDYIVTLLAAGATVGDLSWLIRNGATVRYALELEPADRRLPATFTEQERRVTLLLAAHTGYPYDAAQAVAAAISGTPWADTAIRLILDDIPVVDAVAAARADQNLHDRQQALRVTRTEPAAGRQR